MDQANSVINLPNVSEINKPANTDEGNYDGDNDADVDELHVDDQ